MSSQVGLFIVRTNLRNRQPKRFHQAKITQSLFVDVICFSNQNHVAMTTWPITKNRKERAPDIGGHCAL